MGGEKRAVDGGSGVLRILRDEDAPLDGSETETASRDVLEEDERDPLLVAESTCTECHRISSMTLLVRCESHTRRHGNSAIIPSLLRVHW